MFKALLFASAIFLSAEQTLSIIKPDAVEQDHIGDIQSYIEAEGLKIVATKMIQLSPEQAKSFYVIHKHRPFYKDLIEHMVSGPIVVQVLEGEDSVARNRKIMGSTDPLEASSGTIRKEFGTNIQKNAVHGSDSIENAEKEIVFFFHSDEICKR